MQKWIYKNKNKKGFTLIELVVVIAILGILAAIAVPRLSRSKEAAQVAAHNANVRTLESAGNIYILEYPNMDADVTLEGADLNAYLQKPLIIPDNLRGKSYAGLVVTSPEDPTLIPGTIAIGDTDEYQVEIKVDGSIIVTPGTIVPEE